MSGGWNHCAVHGCNNNRRQKYQKSFFRFPRDKEICKVWVSRCRRSDLDNIFKEKGSEHMSKSYSVCSDHFLEKDFRNKNLLSQGIFRGTVPSIFSDLKEDNSIKSPQKREEEVDPEETHSDPPNGEHSPYNLDTSKFNNILDSVVDPPKEHHSPHTADTCEIENVLDSVVDSVTIDHDYVATTIPGKSPSPVYPKNNDIDLSKQLTLDNVRKELCRLCGQKGSLVMPIFGPAFGKPQDLPISSKIDMYLPIKVKKGDPLPFCICSNCLDVLNHWHELYVTCVAADAVLWKTFGSETDISLNDVDSRMPSQIRQKAAKVTTEIGTQTEQMPSVSLTHETKEKDMACTDCGKNKTETVQMMEEFDKNLANYRHTSYKCRFCYELFKSSADRKNHIAMCRQLATICELCGDKVSCRKDLKRHKYRKHNRKVIVCREYLCDKCDKCFKSAAGLSFHKKNIHDGQDRSMKYFCELCCTAFRQEIYFRNHKRKHEKGKIKTVFQIEPFRQEGNTEGSENALMYSCPVCQEVFSSMLSLVTHLTTKKKIKCSLCHKIMSCEKRFFLHVCGQWTCQYCLKSFDTRVKWIVHERLHTGEKPIKCRVCDLTFRTWHARRRHETHHEPSYQCSYCGKSFRNKYIYQDHVACHEGKQFLCPICDKKFSGRKSVYKHVNIYHKNIKETVCISE